MTGGSRLTAASPRHHAIIARFKEHLKAHPARPMHLVEICIAVGTPERTLRAACEQHLGMGPIRYLNFRRMQLARRALARADHSTATVTQVATDYGFWELGRFSVSYRALFGETPSETLRRAPTVAVRGDSIGERRVQDLHLLAPTTTAHRRSA